MKLTLTLDIKNAINREQALEILQREPWFAGLERGPVKGVANATRADVYPVYEEPFIKLVSIE